MTELLAYLTELMLDGKLSADEARKVLHLVQNARKGVTLKTLASAAGVSRSTYYRHRVTP
jgi:DNA-binding IclR family transcriptional regulator